jgi:hypothetical protein
MPVPRRGHLPHLGHLRRSCDALEHSPLTASCNRISHWSAIYSKTEARFRFPCMSSLALPMMYPPWQTDGCSGPQGGVDGDAAHDSKGGAERAYRPAPPYRTGCANNESTDSSTGSDRDQEAGRDVTDTPPEGKNCDVKHAFLFRESRKPNFRPGKIGQPAFSRLPPHRTLTRTSKIDAKTRNGHIRAAS